MNMVLLVFISGKNAHTEKHTFQERGKNMATAKNTEEIRIRKSEKKFAKIRIVGDSPLIVHAWSEKAKREMLEKQTGSSKTKKKWTKMPFDDFARALYWITPMPKTTVMDESRGEMREVVTEELFDEAINNGAKFGFPANSFKIAGNSAAYRMGWVKNQMALRGAYFITSEFGELAEIKGDVPMIREDTVTVGNGSSDLRYRPIFNNWYCELILEVDTGYGMTMNDIINVLNAGGSGVGIGEWRPEKDGYFGRYHVELIK